MPRDWMDVSNISFNALLLLEEIQLSWLPGWLPEKELHIALKANPVVDWYLRHKCPQLNEWLDHLTVIHQEIHNSSPAEIRQADGCGRFDTP